MAARKGRITVLVLIILLGATFVIFRKPFIRATLPEVEQVTLGEISIRDDTAFVRLELIVRNKGIWHIELQSIRLAIFDGDVELLTYDDDTLHVLQRNQVKKEELFFAIPITAIREQIRLHQGEDTVGLQLRGEIQFSTFLGDMNRSVEQVVPVNVPIPPKLTVRSIEYTGRTDKGDYNLMFHLTLKNYNPRALDMRDLTYELHGDNGIDLRGQLDGVSIAAEDSTRLDVPAVLQVDNRFAVIKDILLDNDQMAYSFVLTGTIESLTGVDARDVPVTVSAVGQMELYNEDKDKRDRPKVARRKKQR
jgi:hypothetical protein